MTSVDDVVEIRDAAVALLLMRLTSSCTIRCRTQCTMSLVSPCLKVSLSAGASVLPLSSYNVQCKSPSQAHRPGTATNAVVQFAPRKRPTVVESVLDELRLKI